MEKTTCDFCHRDNSDDMEKICGELHVQKLNVKYIAAHRKCMQYSAQLIQYKFDNFGGFKIDKVLGEIKRGQLLKCTICKGNRGKRKKSKDGYNVNGATAGCALLSCRKTYHYCCANSDPTAITKRMVIKFKDQGEQVMYRVFCCLDHEKKFRSNKSELYLPFQSGKNSSSESSSEDDDDVDEDDDEEEEDDEEAGGEEEVSMSDSDIEGINNNSMSDSDIEGKNNNHVCTPDNSDSFDSFINDISALTQDESKSLQDNINASAMEDNERSAGMFDQVSPEKEVNNYPKADRQMFDNEDDDFDDVTGDLSLQPKSLYDNWSDEGQKQNEPLTTDDNSKNQSVTNNVIVKRDRIPDTPNSIKIKAQINHVPDPKPKNSTPTKRAQGTKRSLLSKLSGSQRFVCVQCSSTYDTDGQLKRHHADCHGPKLTCTECEVTFPESQFKNHLRECLQIPITALVETPEVFPMTPLRSPESISVSEPTKEQKRDFDLPYEDCEQVGVDLEPPRKVIRVEPTGDARDFLSCRKVVAASLPRDITSVQPATTSITHSCSEPPTIMYFTTAVTATADNHINIESPQYTSVIDKDLGTTDLPKPSACSEFTASFRLPDGSKYTCTSSIVADPTNPTPPEKTDVAIQCDIIDFQQFQEFQKFQEFQEFQKFQEFQEFQKFIEKKNSFKN